MLLSVVEENEKKCREIKKQQQQHANAAASLLYSAFVFFRIHCLLAFITEDYESAPHQNQRVHCILLCFMQLEDSSKTFRSIIHLNTIIFTKCCLTPLPRGTTPWEIRSYFSSINLWETLDSFNAEK